MTSVFGILFVCTGNICRSAMSEALLRHLLRDLPGGVRIQVASAGTEALAGEPMVEGAARTLQEEGVPTDFLRSRGLTPHLLERADLALVMERRHLSRALQMSPLSMRRCFLLPEFARLAAPPYSEPPPPDLAARGRWLTELAAGRRGDPGLGHASAGEVSDPLGEAVPDFRGCAEQILDGLRPLLDVLYTLPHPRLSPESVTVGDDLRHAARPLDVDGHALNGRTA